MLQIIRTIINTLTGFIKKGNGQMSKEVTYSAEDGTEISATLCISDSPKGNIVFAHGITVDRHEDFSADTGIGAFDEVVDILRDYNTLLFDFRGHGKSGGKQEEMTINGELLDLRASVEYLQNLYPNLPTGIVAASFGAVSTVMYVSGRNDIATIVLWNPVLDLQKTFIDPIVPWAKGSFNEKGYASLKKNGYLMLDDYYRIGATLVEEMRILRPYSYMSGISCPVLTIHGDQDSYVPFVVAKEYAIVNDKSRFISISGSEHGFGKREDRDLVVQKTVEWINDLVL